MKILQLPRKFPYPIYDGEALHLTYLAKALKEKGCDMVMLSVNPIKQPYDIRNLPKSYDYFRAIHLIDLDNRVKPLPALYNLLFSRESYHITRFISKAIEDKLIELLQQEEFDIVQLESLNMSPYLEIVRKYSKAKVIMRAHNVEHEIWERVIANTGFGPKKLYLQMMTNRLKRYEIARMNLYDGMLAVSERDMDILKRLGCTIPSMAVMVGLDLADYASVADPEFDNKTSFGFIGSLDWLPNQEAIHWLVEQVWPQVIARRPDARLKIAGRNCPAWLKNSNWPGIEVVGEVPDAKAFIQEHPLQLAPLQAGSGVRIKILDAMACGAVVMSTSIGIEGIPAENSKHALVADAPEAFAEAMLYSLEHPEQMKSVSIQAKELIANYFDNRRTSEALLQFYERVIASQ